MDIKTFFMCFRQDVLQSIIIKRLLRNKSLSMTLGTENLWNWVLAMKICLVVFISYDEI